MYNGLDSPPPRSQFLPSSYGRQYTRPWSPDPYEPLPSTIGGRSRVKESREAFNQLQREQHSPRAEQEAQPKGFVEELPPLLGDQFPVVRSKQRREASEASVEALDLADYARTLRSRQAEDPYPAFPFADASLNSSTREVQSRTSQNRYPPHPPSAYPAHVSRGGTRSSNHSSTTASHQTPRSNVTVPMASTSRSGYGRTYQRPHSLPTSPNGSTPYFGQKTDPDDEIDISQFPAWSRGWYANDSQRSRGRPQSRVDSLEAYELQAGLALPQPLLNGSSSKRDSPAFMNAHSHDSIPSGTTRNPISPFDPAYIHPQSYPKNSSGHGTVDDYPSYAAPSYSNHDPLLGDSREGVVPWSYDPPEYGQAPLDPQVKEQRMRMLEKAFGSPNDSKNKDAVKWKDKGKERAKDDGLMRDDRGRLIVGTPDGKGELATQGPRMRAAIKFVQILLAIAVGGPIIWAGVALRPNPAPPPAGRPPLYILYVLSPITLLLLLYLFVVRPCALRRRYSSSSYTHPAAAQGMMVLPVAGPGGGGKKGGKKGGKGGPMMMPGGYSGGKKGKKGKGGGMMGDVQVNLIVDPNAFGLPGDQDLSSSSDDDDIFDDGGMPGAFFAKGSSGRNTPQDTERARKKRKRQKRRTLMASLKLEEDWKLARAWIRKMAFLNALLFLLWGVAFGFVIAGKRCPTAGREKGYGGWCTAYNASTAASCLLCISFSISIFFGVKDLYASKLSPRTRV